MTDKFQMLPPLSTDEFERLKADIEANGITDPVVVDEVSGAIVDGHHRRDIAALLNIELPQRAVRFGSDGECVAFAFRANMNRRHLTREQAKAMRESMKQLAVELYEDHTQEQIGGLLGVTRRTVGNWLDASKGNVSKACIKTKDKRTKVDKTDKAEIVERAESGETQEQIAADHGISRQRAGQIIEDEKAKKEERQRKVEAAETYAPNIICTPVNEATSHIKHGTIDVIITDPPYPKEHLHTFDELSEAASVLLKPGGLCVVMSGQMYLPEVYANLTKHLDYYWTAAYHTAGQSSNIRHRNVTVTWKPLIILTNGDAPDLRWFTDRTISEANDKEHHDWGQSISGTTSIVEQYSEPGDLVYDPFVGGGTTAIAALRLGRRFIGSDNDDRQCKLTTTRMAEDG